MDRAGRLPSDRVPPPGSRGLRQAPEDGAGAGPRSLSAPTVRAARAATVRLPPRIARALLDGLRPRLRLSAPTMIDAGARRGPLAQGPIARAARGHSPPEPTRPPLRSALGPTRRPSR